MINIILSGGSGTRLWPISRKLFPKQFNKIIDNESLFQKTILRNKKVCNSFLVVTNEEQYFMAKDQLEEIKINSLFLLESIGKNTAPAIALACFNLDYDEIVLVTPSDHIINNQKEYERVVKKAKDLAKEGFLVTFGITPKYPETGYGYIEANGKWIMDNEELEGLDVKQFHEKPDLETAKKYLEANSKTSSSQPSALSPQLFLWNSGIFCFKAGVFLDELKTYSPKIHEACQEAYNKEK